MGRSAAVVLTMCLGLTLGLSSTVRGDLIVGYTSANGATVSPDAIGAGVTGNDLVRGAGVSQAGGGGSFRSDGWSQSDLADAIANDDYLQWGFTSSLAYNLSDLDIRYGRSGTGPNQIEIQIDTGSGFSTIFSDSSVVTSGETQLDIDLSSFQGITTATFRLYGFGASNNNGSFDINNDSLIEGDRGIVVNGIAVPEPSSVLFLAPMLVALVGWRFRKSLLPKALSTSAS